MRTQILRFGAATRLALLGALLALAACGQGGTLRDAREKPEAPDAWGLAPQSGATVAKPGPSGSLNFPLPAALLQAGGARRSVSYVYEDVVKAGDEYDPLLPNNRVAPSAPALDFAPAAGPLSGLGDCSFAVYRFSVEDYSGDLVARSFFSSDPAAGTCWLGAANWGANRWDWAAWTSAAQNLGPSAPYLAGPPNNGLIMIAVLFTGGGGSLNTLALGADIPPLASFAAAPNPVAEGAPVSFDASASLDLDTSIALYEWDFENDGTFDVSDTQPLASRSFLLAGDYTVVLRVTAADSGSDTASTSLSVTPGAGNNPPVAGISASAQTGDAPLSVDFNAGTSSDSDGVIQKYEWDWDGDATYDLDSGAISTANHVYAAPGIFNATVRVTDDDGATDTELVTITVTEAQLGEPPAAALTTTKWWEKPNVDLNFSGATSFDPDGSIVKYEWDWEGDGDFEEDTGATATATHQYASIGLRTAVLRVTDSDGNTDTDSLDVYVYTGGPYDEVEDNDTSDTGNVIGGFPVEYFDGNVGPGGYNGDDEDWYRLTIAAPSGIQIDLRLEDDDCDIDMKLYDTDGTTEIGSSTGTDDDETITEFVAAAGTYFLKVYKFSGAPADAVADYFFNICVSNDSVSANLTANVTSGAAPLAVHMQAFSPPAEFCGLAAKAVRWDLDSDGDWETDTRLANQGEVDVVFYRPGFTYTVTVEVTDFADVVTTDSVSITTSGALEEAEPNDTFDASQAVSLPLTSFDGEVGDLSSNGSIEDWLDLGSLATGGNLTLHMDLFDPLCDIDMVVYRADGTTSVGTSAGTDDTEDIDVTLPADETYYLKVYVFSGNSLKSGGYRLSGSYASP